MVDCARKESKIKKQLFALTDIGTLTRSYKADQHNFDHSTR